VSGGVFNPALATAQICWQNLTWYYKIGQNTPYWEPAYAACTIFGPLLGAYAAANLFNLQKKLEQGMAKYDPENDSDKESVFSFSSRPKSWRTLNSN
jgi:hypothetical protein